MSGSRTQLILLTKILNSVQPNMLWLRMCAGREWWGVDGCFQFCLVMSWLIIWMKRSDPSKHWHKTQKHMFCFLFVLFFFPATLVLCAARIVKSMWNFSCKVPFIPFLLTKTAFFSCSAELQHVFGVLRSMEGLSCRVTVSGDSAKPTYWCWVYREKAECKAPELCC